MTHPWHCPNTLLYFKLVEKMFLLSSSFHFSLFTAEKGWRKHDALIKCQWNTPLLSKLCLHRQRCQFDWEKVWFVVFRWESAGTMNLCANVAFLCFKKKFSLVFFFSHYIIVGCVQLIAQQFKKHLNAVRQVNHLLSKQVFLMARNGPDSYVDLTAYWHRETVQ